MRHLFNNTATTTPRLALRTSSHTGSKRHISNNLFKNNNLKRLVSTSSPSTMSLFPRSFYTPADTSFAPLFRLLDDFDNYSRDVHGTSGTHDGRRGIRAARAFQPRFDVRETENAYELHGELPGIARENLNIEFTEPQTLVVSGRIERSYSSGTPPAGLVEAGEKGKERIAAPADSDAAATDKSNAGNNNNNNNGDAAQREKYWVSERSVGEFTRTFSFPTPVDQDGVAAGLDNGVLNLTVPKAKKKESRRITIN